MIALSRSHNSMAFRRWYVNTKLSVKLSETTNCRRRPESCQVCFFYQSSGSNEHVSCCSVLHRAAASLSEPLKTLTNMSHYVA